MISLIYLILLFLLAIVATTWIYKKVLKVAKDKNIVDNPDVRKVHRVPVPILGGLAVFWGIVVSLAAAGIFTNNVSLFEVGCIMTIMLIVGTLDDLLSLSPTIRFVIEILAVLALIYSNGYSINDFHGLWGIYQIPDLVAIPFTVFACVGIINSINLIDGVNGLSSGFCIITCIIFCVLFYLSGDMSGAVLAITSVGALLPFFFHNVFGQKSKMFIGDGGTMLMGIIISTFVINVLREDSVLSNILPENMGIVPFTLAVVAIPVFDTLRVMSLRIIRGRSPFMPDKTHLHHLLMDLHFSHVGITVTEILANLFVLSAWYVSYLLGASVDVQLYVVIILSMGITFGFYKYARHNERKQTDIYKKMTKVGDWTHVGHTHWFEWLTKILDREC